MVRSRFVPADRRGIQPTGRQEREERTSTFAVAFVFKGIVEQVDANAKRVTVTNENIPGWQNYKKMTYKVDNPEVLKTVKRGDRVTAKVYEGDFKVLYDLRVVPPEDTPVVLPKKQWQ